MPRRITIALASGIDKRLMILSADLNQKLGNELYQKVFSIGLEAMEKKAGKKL